MHCDLSPGNIVVGWGGTVKLVDFGIARATIMLRESDHSVAGKYNYMAPEQIRGEAVDARADLFALGIILYELTVGKRLFRGRPEQVIRLVLDEPIVKPTELRPDFPASLEQIIMRALERDPARRYQTARELRTDLMAWLAESGLPHDKRRIAEYLRGIFNLKKQRDADEFSRRRRATTTSWCWTGRCPSPRAELQVDAEDPAEELHVERRPRPASCVPSVRCVGADRHRAADRKAAGVSLAKVRGLGEPRKAPARASRASDDPPHRLAESQLENDEALFPLAQGEPEGAWRRPRR